MKINNNNCCDKDCEMPIMSTRNALKWLNTRVCKLEETVKTIYTEPDSDGDGFTDREELIAGSNPNNPASTPNNPCGYLVQATDSAFIDNTNLTVTRAFDVNGNGTNFTPFDAIGWSDIGVTPPPVFRTMTDLGLGATQSPTTTEESWAITEAFFADLGLTVLYTTTNNPLVQRTYYFTEDLATVQAALGVTGVSVQEFFRQGGVWQQNDNITLSTVNEVEKEIVVPSFFSGSITLPDTAIVTSIASGYTSVDNGNGTITYTWATQPNCILYPTFTYTVPIGEDASFGIFEFPNATDKIQGFISGVEYELN